MATPYATATEVRTYDAALTSPTDYPDTYLTDLVTEFEQIAEEYMGVAYAVRDAVETVQAVYRVRQIVLDHWPLVAVASITVNGTLVDSTTGYLVNPSTGVIGFLNYWPNWSSSYSTGPYNQTIVVTYTYGNAAPPAMLKRACFEYVRSVALLRTSGVSRDIVYQSMDGMTTRYTPTPDRDAGTPTGYRDVDRILNMLRQRAPAVA